MEKKLIFIENEDGLLFRGVAPGLPDERWDLEKRAFVPYDGGPKPVGWGEKISAERALELMAL